LVNTAEGIFFVGDIFANGADAAGRGGDGSVKAELGTRGELLVKGRIESRGGHSLVYDAPAGLGGTLSVVSGGVLELRDGADLSGGDNSAGLRAGGGGGTFIAFAPTEEDLIMGEPVLLDGGSGLSEGPSGKFHLNDFSVILPEELIQTQQIN
jgi:hypothetical protein